MTAKKILTAGICALLGIVLLLLILVAALNLGGAIGYGEFYSTAESEIKMPGLGEGFIPQGLDKCGDGFLISGYMKDKSASPLYYVTEGGVCEKTLLFQADGSKFTGHSGGVAHYDDYVYVGGSGGMYIFSLEDVMDGDGKATQRGFFEAGMTASWVSLYGGHLYIGKFVDGGSYEGEEWQACTTPAGDKNVSVIAAFRLNDRAEYGLEPVPEFAYSMREWVQGAAFTDEGVILSTSSGINSSVLYFYERNDEYVGEISYGGEHRIPLYYLDSETLTYELKAIPMAEEIEVVDDRVYISNESACTKYVFGNLNGGYNFYSFLLKDEYFGN